MRMADGFTNSTQNKTENCHIGTIHYSIFSLMDIITFLIGQPVIATLMWLILKSKKKTDILNLNLCLFHNLQHFVSIVHLLCLFLSEIHLKVIGFLLVYVEIGGPMSLTFICMERYCAVIYPTSYPLLRKYRLRELCAVFVWFVSLPTAVYSIYTSETYPSLREFSLKTLPIALMGSMMSMIVSFNISIAKELKKSGPGRNELHPAKKRALRTIYGTAAIIVLCYSPVTVLQHLTYSNDYTYNCVTIPVCILFLSVASVVHPLFYFSTQGKLCPCSKPGKKMT